MPEHILPHALKLPAIKKLSGKRIILASNSSRRQEILRTFVGGLRLHATHVNVKLIISRD
jgi:hypothetical protein